MKKKANKLPYLHWERFIPGIFGYGTYIGAKNL